LLRQLWIKWKAIATAIGNLQARIFLSLFYFLIVTPFGLVVRFLSDPLYIKRRQEPTFWRPKTLSEPTVEEARKQF